MSIEPDAVEPERRVFAVVIEPDGSMLVDDSELTQMECIGLVTMLQDHYRSLAMCDWEGCEED